MSGLRRTFVSVFAIACACGLGIQTAWAVGEQNGKIAGQVTEADSGAPVPGAEIRASSPSLIGPDRKTLSDDDGRYFFDGLTPGRYDLEISYAGVKPTKRRVQVRLGETTPLDIKWSPEMKEAEVTVVVEERHFTKPDQTQTGTVIAADSQSKIATQRSYQSVLKQVASVRDVNGGGNPQVKGASLLGNRYLIDGLDITDPVTNTFSANINFDSIQSIEVLTGGMEAQYNAMGGVFNLVTNAGSDQLRIDSGLYINNAAFSAGGQYGREPLSSLRPFASDPRPSNQQYQAYINAGGPIQKRRLWINASFQFDYTERSQPIGPPVESQHPARRYMGYLARIKLTYAPSTKHRVTLSISSDPAFIDNTRQGNSGLAVSERRQEQGGAFAILSWDYFRSDRLSFNVQAGYQFNQIISGPQAYLGAVSFENDPRFSAANYRYDFQRARHINLADGSGWYNGGDLTRDKRHTFQLDPSVTLRGKALGTHEAKIGLQSRYVSRGFEFERPGGALYLDNGAGPGEGGLCDEVTGSGCFQKETLGKYSTSQWGYTLGFFAQDRWKVHPRVTILPGVRLDWGITKNSVGETVSNLFGIGPRLGAVVNLTKDAKTVLSAFYGRANEVMSLLVAANADYSALATTSQWDAAANGGKGGFVPQRSSGGAGGYRIDPNAKTPHTDEITLSLRREIFKDSLGGIDYTWKRISNIWDGVEVNQIWNPAGSNVVGYVNGRAEQIFRYTTPDLNYRIYHGVDFYLEARPTQSVDLYAAYTLSWLYGPGSEQLGQIDSQYSSPFYNPRQTRFSDGFLPEDVRHQLKIRGSYSWKGLNLGVFLLYSTGSPLTKTYFNNYDGDYTRRRTPSGTDPGAIANDPKSITELRLPATMTTDLRVSYDFHHLLKQHVIVIADFFNLFNLDAPIDVETRDLPQYSQVLARQAPFRFQLGLRYQY